MVSFVRYTNPKCVLCLSTENKIFLKWDKEDGTTSPRHICDNCVEVINNFKELGPKDECSSRTITFETMPLTSDPDNDGECCCCEDEEDFED